MRSRYLWPALVVVGVMVGILGTLLINRTYFFVDDTQIGAYGQWYEIGTRILIGNWSPINPLVWQSGNYLAEGAWGLYSPPLWLIGVASHVVPNALWFSTGVKVFCLVLGGLGAYVLSRSFGVRRGFAAAVGVAAPFVGVTFYLDAPSWVNGLLAWSFFGLAWGLSRRAILTGKGVVLAVLASVFLVGIGYFHATLFLAVALAATLVEALLRRHLPTVMRGVVVSLCAGLFAVVVHLPALLTSGVSGRVQSIVNTGLLTADLSGIAASNTPVGVPQVGLWGVNFPDAPLLYTAWFIPLFFFIDWSKFLPLLRARLSILIVLGVALVGVLLPSDFGPLRIPIRMMPYFSLPLLIVLALGLSRALFKPVPFRRFVAATAYIVASAWLTFVQSPKYGLSIFAMTVATIVVFWVMFRLVSAGRTARGAGDQAPERSAGLARRRTVWLPLVMIVGAFSVVWPQHLVHPTGPLSDYQVPRLVSELQSPLQEATGDVLVVGGITDGVIHPEDWAETSIGNLWYLPEARVQNAYTSVFYPGYQDALCMVYQGSTCADLYQRLFTAQPDTGNLLVDDLGVSSIQLVKRVFTANEWTNVPDGWTVVEDTELTRLIVRDSPVDGAGGVVWTSDGLTVSAVESGEDTVTFVAESVPDEGGTVALSRISWPGYEVAGGTVSDELLDGFLMAVDIPASSEGQTVSVTFRNPGWPVQVAAAALLALVLVLWTTLRIVARVRSRRAATPGAEGTLIRVATERTPRHDPDSREPDRTEPGRHGSEPSRADASRHEESHV